MTITEEVRNLQREGRTEHEIVSELKKRGVPEKEVFEAISQAKIKDAVFSDELDNSEEYLGNPINSENQNYQGTGVTEIGSAGNAPTPTQEFPKYTKDYSAQDNGQYSGMQPSLLNQDKQQTYSPESQQSYQQSYNSDFYPQYQPYQETMSADMITEISEQVVSEKLAILQDKLEKVIDLKTVLETRISSVSERLTRIEKIIDRLQLSLLQKVGEYVNDVQDVKKELEETQKSFIASHRKKEIHHEHKHH